MIDNAKTLGILAFAAVKVSGDRLQRFIVSSKWQNRKAGFVLFVDGDAGRGVDIPEEVVRRIQGQTIYAVADGGVGEGEETIGRMVRSDVPVLRGWDILARESRRLAKGGGGKAPAAD